jgi:hypothetical protein
MTMSILTVRRWIVLAPLALVLLAAVALASAATTGAQTNPCQYQFTVLQADTQSAPITGGKIDKERAGLFKIIDDAEALVSDGKTSDAVTKLRNFTVKVDQLEAAGRISAEDADLLRSDAQATIACLEGSTTSTA